MSFAPVLVVGAGPGGLTAALTLARYGVPVLVVERRQVLSGLPRATGVSLRSMELFRRFGVEPALLEGGIDVEWTSRAGRTLATMEQGRTLSLGYPTRAESARLSPSMPAVVPQDHLEPVLLRRLLEHDCARVSLGTEVVAVRQGEDDVRVTLRDTSTGQVRDALAEHVIAADGAHSVVREAVGVGMVGPDRLTDAVSVLFQAPLWDVVGEHRHGLYLIGHEEAAGVLLPAGSGDRWLYGALWSPDGPPPSSFDREDVVRRIRLATGVPDLRVRLETSGRFTFAAQVADAFRSGRVFLVGDAAHRVTPRGGTGMNTAILDGHDLGWKLAWVLNAWSTPTLLDSYESERRPIAEHNAARSALPDGASAPPAQELHADLVGRLPHVWVRDGRQDVSSLDLLGPGLTVLASDGEPWREAARSLPVPVCVRAVGPVTAGALGVPDEGAVVVRPDGAVVGLGRRGEAARTELRRAWEAVGQPEAVLV